MYRLLAGMLALISMLPLNAQEPPIKREMRGAWIATAFSIDWPTAISNQVQQRNLLTTIMDHHKQTGINTVYFQVRSNSDAMYPSTIEPWSNDLRNGYGVAPNPVWDPLQTAIDLAHGRGMELHAWINPYRAGSPTTKANFTSAHVTKQHPEWLLETPSAVYLNPALPAVRNYIVSVITDILTRYDVDGIHFDDFFYPPGLTNQDQANFAADPRGFTVIADWRRDNVNLLIQQVYQTILSLKPWVKFGISPSGIYRSSTNPAIGSNTSSGANQHYSSVYADSKKWLQEGWVDYIEPQVYWYIGQTGSDYNILVPWWNDNSFGRHIYIGMAGYKVNDAAQGAPWLQPTMIPREMRLNRSKEHISGQSVYNTNALRSNALNFRDSIRLRFYQKPALQPTMPWRDNMPPGAPSALSASRSGNVVTLNWTNPPGASNELDKVKRLVVYRSETFPVDLNNANNILAITVNDATGFTDNTASSGVHYFYTVTALDRFQNESTPSNTAFDVPPSITCPGTQVVSADNVCFLFLPDYTNMAQTQNAISVTQNPEVASLLMKGTYTITLTATNVAGQTAACSFTLQVVDDLAPVITACPENITTTTDAGLCSATINPGMPEVSDNCGVASIVGVRSDNQPLTAPYQKGNTTITWTVKDEAGNSSSCIQSIHVADLEAPAITNASANPSSLWPPNHKMRKVNVSYTIEDNCGPVTSFLTVSSNEPQDGTEEDWEITNNHQVKLRAERDGSGSGRIYTITIHATDAAGNSNTYDVEVQVPHDHSDITSARTGDMQVLLPEGNVSVTPNPAKGPFVIHITGTASYSYRLMDANGRLLQSGKKNNSSFTIGDKLLPGIYYLEIVQGTQKKVLRLVKQ